jgi:ATP-binding cassette subfamily B protein
VLASGLELLEQPTPVKRAAPSTWEAETEALRFQEMLEFRGVDFWHKVDIPVLHRIDLAIHPGEWIGLAGPTGSGKSTLLDLLMGLLSPCRGEIAVDRLPLEQQDPPMDRRSAWQRHLAHVPQTIFLADASIAANIAFGVAPEHIDEERLAWAAATAQAEEFITRLPHGFDTPVGEGGLRLSGGQRQRLGMARALYKRADVLILDEATSALDNLTEQRVMESLWRASKGLTVVMVAHRLSTLRRCDRIIDLQGGRISSIGTYEELAASSATFRGLAEASSKTANPASGEAGLR